MHSHRRFTEGCAPDESFRSHGLGKQLCKCAVSDADCLAGGSVCSLLSLIMPHFSQMWHGPISPQLFEIAQFLFVFFFFFFFFFLVTYFKKCAGSSFYLELQF